MLRRKKENGKFVLKHIATDPKRILDIEYKDKLQKALLYGDTVQLTALQEELKSKKASIDAEKDKK